MTMVQRARCALGAAVLAGALVVVAGPAEAVAPVEHPSAITVTSTSRVTHVTSPVAGRAAAKKPTGRGTAYGGHVAGGSEYPVVFWLNPAKSAVIRAVTAYHAECTAGLAFNLVDNASVSVPVGPNGTFSLERPGSYDLGNGITAETKVTITGKVKDRRITGTAALHVDEKDAAGAQVATCDTASSFGTRSWPGRVYAGATNENGPVVIELPKDRSKVAHFRIGWQSVCESDAEFQVADDQLNFRIRKSKWGDAYDARPYETADGGKGVDHYVVRGKVRKRKATGTFRVKTDETDQAGNPSDTCDSGPLTYVARSG